MDTESKEDLELLLERAKMLSKARTVELTNEVETIKLPTYFKALAEIRSSELNLSLHKYIFHLALRDIPIFPSFIKFLNEASRSASHKNIIEIKSISEHEILLRKAMDIFQSTQDKSRSTIKLSKFEHEFIKYKSKDHGTPASKYITDLILKDISTLSNTKV